jgi:hypothetical protein
MLEPAATPAANPTALFEASTAPAAEGSPDCAPQAARGFFSRPQVPMPPELQGRAVIVRTGAIRVSGKAPTLKPYAVKDLSIGSLAGGSVSFGLAAFKAAFGFESVSATQSFSFRLLREDAHGTPPVEARCVWGAAMATGGAGRRSLGIEMRVPQGNATLCELFDAPDGEPWRLFLWVGPPSKLVPPEFPSGGGLVRGEVRYEATSINAIKPALLGLDSTLITGTFFTRDGRTVAAVERLVPSRILMQCSVPPAEQSIFVAIGAALSIRDGLAMRFEH